MPPRGAYGPKHRNMGELQMKTDALLNVFRKAHQQKKGVNLQMITLLFECKRRIYDVTNVLMATGLIEKVRIPSNNRASATQIVYIWKGPEQLNQLFGNYDEHYDEQLSRPDERLDSAFVTLPLPLHPDMRIIHPVTEEEEKKDEHVIEIQSTSEESASSQETEVEEEQKVAEDPPVQSWISPLREDYFEVKELSENYFIESDYCAEGQENLPKFQSWGCYCGLGHVNNDLCFRFS